MFCLIQINLTHNWWGWQRETITIDDKKVTTVLTNVCKDCGVVKSRKYRVME